MEYQKVKFCRKSADPLTQINKALEEESQALVYSL